MLIYLTSLGAGLLASLSPCVLPVLPIMASSSTAESRRGPLYLATGMILSFVLVGLLFNSFTSLLGLSEEGIRAFSAWMLVLFGVVLLVPLLKERMSRIMQPLASFAFKKTSSSGQFMIGFFLGAAWGPCVGPTLGIALGLASTQGGLLQAAGMMSLFGLGLALPFLGIAYGLRGFLATRQKGFLSMNKIGSRVLGGSLALVGGMILIGVDRLVERHLVSILPLWFLELSASI